MSQTIHNDEQGMRAALEWSHRGRGWTSPRPSVGCVIVQDGRIIGGGHTQPGDGNPHAEVMALRRAEEAGHISRGATAYVTLEPCSHYATTPPCTNALIEAGIARVVYGVRDPNPEVNGRGAKQLRAAGVEVVEEYLRDECIRAQAEFLKNIVTGLPFVTLKCATSLDGKIATCSGHSQWITNPLSRQRAHKLRHEHDAVLVGIETLLADDPLLNVRLEGEWKQPQRIVLDSRGRIPLDAKLLSDHPERVLVATTTAMPATTHEALVERGARVLVLPEEEGRVSLQTLWGQLAPHKIYSVLVEGGAQVAASVLRTGVIDRIAWFVAPLVIGGDGLSAVPPLGIESLDYALRLRDVQTEVLDGDVFVSGFTHDIM